MDSDPSPDLAGLLPQGSLTLRVLGADPPLLAGRHPARFRTYDEAMSRHARPFGLVVILTAVLGLLAIAPAVARPGQPVPPVSPSDGAAALAQAPAPDTLAGLYSTTSMDLILLERRKGPAAALKALERRIEKDGRLGGVCHAIAHEIGHEALTEAGGNVSKALTNRNDVCGGGYTHGIIEVALGSSKHPAKDLLVVCAPKQDGSCFHGVGHGLMFATGMDLARSLRLCDKSPTSMLVARCGEGVFMQLFGADASTAHLGGASPPTLASARTTCRGTRARYAANCWFYAPTVWLAARPDDFTGAMGWCSAAGSTLGAQLCAKGVGSRTIKYHPDDPRIGAAVCAASGDLTDPCLSGMGSYWSVHFKGQKPPSDVCGHLGSAALATRCRAVT